MRRLQPSCSPRRAATLLDGMARGVGEEGGRVGGACFAGAREDLGEVEKPGLVRLAGRPEGGVGEEPGHEVDDAVAQAVADAGRIVAGAPEVGELGGFVGGQAVAVLPDAEERLPGLVEDLIARPRLEVDRALGFDLLAVVDLPGIGLVVGDERVGVEELEQVVLDGGGGPGLLLEEADGGLVAVEGRAQLAFLDQGPGPEGVVGGGAGRFADAGALGGGGLEFLLTDELLDGLAGGLGLSGRLGIIGHGWFLRGWRGEFPGIAGDGRGAHRTGAVADDGVEPGAQNGQEDRQSRGGRPALACFFGLDIVPVPERVIHAILPDGIRILVGIDSPFIHPARRKSP